LKTLPSADALLDNIVDALEPRLPENPLLFGIHTGGVWFAKALHQRLNISSELCTLDITFYRDDFSTIGLHPQVNTSVIHEDIDDRNIILVDDVLQTGRTIRAALNEVFSYGRPRSVMLVVMVDRGMRELPVQADVCGLTLDLESHQQVKLHSEDDLSLVITDRNS
jgi:pyrimidine operon attenuation protein / uracil phosphoribosyltransferase